MTQVQILGITLDFFSSWPISKSNQIVFQKVITKYLCWTISPCDLLILSLLFYN